MLREVLKYWSVLGLVVLLVGCKSINGIKSFGASDAKGEDVKSSVKKISGHIEVAVVNGPDVSFEAPIVLGYNQSWNRKDPDSFYRTCELSSQRSTLLAEIDDAAVATLKAAFDTVSIAGDKGNVQAGSGLATGGRLKISNLGFKHRLSCGGRIDGQHMCEYRSTLEFKAVFDHPSVGSKSYWTERTFKDPHPAPLMGPTDCKPYEEIAVEGVRSATKDAVRFFVSRIGRDLGNRRGIESVKPAQNTDTRSNPKGSAPLKTVFVVPTVNAPAGEIQQQTKVPGRYLVQTLNSRALLIGLPRTTVLRRNSDGNGHGEPYCNADVDFDAFGKRAIEIGRSVFSSQFEEVVFSFVDDKELADGHTGYDGIIRLTAGSWNPSFECSELPAKRRCEYLAGLTVRAEYKIGSRAKETFYTTRGFKKSGPHVPETRCENFSKALAEGIETSVRIGTLAIATKIGKEIQKSR